MTDIVERLRICAGGPGDAHTVVICRLTRDTARDAAAEIEWLRGERNRLAADLAKAHREALAWMQKANQTAGKVSVTRALVQSVLEDAEAFITAEYVINDEIHPADRPRYIRDMADIVALRAELQSQSAERESPAAQEAAHG